MKNSKVFWLSVIALLLMILTFTVHWVFVIPAAILSGVGWKILMER